MLSTCGLPTQLSIDILLQLTSVGDAVRGYRCPRPLGKSFLHTNTVLRGQEGRSSSSTHARTVFRGQEGRSSSSTHATAVLGCLEDRRGVPIILRLSLEVREDV